MNVLIAGMPRSASTALFNIVRFIYEQKGVNYRSCWFEDHNKEDEKEYNVMKIHFFDEKIKDWADYIITPRRDIRDVISSYYNVRSSRGNKAIDLATAYIGWYNDWVEYSNNIIEYKDFIDDSFSIVENISKDIGFDSIDSKKVIDDVNKTYDNAKNRKIPVGMVSNHLFGHSHVTNGGVGYYNDVLKKEEIKEINDKYKDWLLKYNYEI